MIPRGETPRRTRPTWTRIPNAKTAARAMTANRRDFRARGGPSQRPRLDFGPQNR